MVLDSSANDIGLFESGTVKRAHTGTGHFESTGPRATNQRLRDEDFTMRSICRIPDTD